MHQPSPICVQATPPQLSTTDMDKACLPDADTYNQLLSGYKKRLLVVQQAYYHQKRRAIIVMEGWDASGKGGAIRHLTEKMDPRGFRVHPIGKPSADEQGKHYLYRFQKRLPRAGTFAIFDRSWYGRVLVERVEKLAPAPAWQRAYQEINEFERQLVDDGVRICKCFLHVTPDEQARRFIERLNNPLKRWKMTREDIRNRKHWAAYEQAINDMFARTSTEAVPWHLIPANHKWFARVEVIRHIVETLEQGVDIQPPPIDPELLAHARDELGFQPDRP